MAAIEIVAETWTTLEASPPRLGDDVRYTWWSQRLGVRDRNIGWRIDHVLVSEDLLPRVRAAHIWDHVGGSDHCPVGIDLDP